MSLYQNPLDNPTHDLFQDHQAAWEAKRSGDPILALRLWQELLDQKRPAIELTEYIEIRRQMAVCLRLVWRLEESDEVFAECYKKAQAVHDDLVRAVVLDWSAVLLDKNQSNDATALLELVFSNLYPSHVAYSQVQAYLGRACSRRRYRVSRTTGRDLMLEAMERLEGDLKFDVGAWLLEVYFWRGRHKHFLRMWQYARQECPARQKDIMLRYLGGWRLHRLVRRAVGAMYRFRDK
jgi:hypothetical protein